jgi:hypothetical protein
MTALAAIIATAAAFAIFGLVWRAPGADTEPTADSPADCDGCPLAPTRQGAGATPTPPRQPETTR